MDPEKNRTDRIKELYEYAQHLPEAGVWSKVFNYARVKWFVANITAKDYADTVVELLKQGKVAPLSH